MSVADRPDDNLITTVAGAISAALSCADGVSAPAPTADALAPGVSASVVAGGFALRLDTVMVAPGDTIAAALRLRQMAARICRERAAPCVAIDVVIHDVAFAAPGPADG